MATPRGVRVGTRVRVGLVVRVGVGVGDGSMKLPGGSLTSSAHSLLPDPAGSMQIDNWSLKKLSVLGMPRPAAAEKSRLVRP
ncbi:MAG: hypothetical protein ABI780_12815, partial [Ardenticatenales bacterium]